MTGSFESIEPTGENRGPVGVAAKHRFVYADGSPFFAMGTTVYAWFCRPAAIRQQTLRSTQRHGFNISAWTAVKLERAG